MTMATKTTMPPNSGMKLTGRPPKKSDMQAVLIREVPVKLVQRWRTAVARNGMTLSEWFLLAAARTADDYESRGNERRGK